MELHFELEKQAPILSTRAWSESKHAEPANFVLCKKRGGPFVILYFVLTPAQWLSFWDRFASSLPGGLVSGTWI